MGVTTEINLNDRSQNMTHPQKIKYLKVACNVAGLGLNEKQTDLLISLYELVLANGGETDLDSILDTKYKCEKREFDNNLIESL